MSLYSNHVAKWSNCTACDLCKTRRKVVLARGSIPCDVLFCGEGPGPSEDVLGKPFTGPAGKLLDHIVEVALTGYGVTWAFTNLVCCLPQNTETGKKFDEPPEYAIKACARRLTEFIDICDPKLIVRVGQLAAKKVLWNGQRKVLDIVHPAAILRADISQKELAVRRCIVQISDAVASLTDL